MLQVWVEDLDGDGDEDFYYPKYGEFGGLNPCFGGKIQVMDL